MGIGRSTGRYGISALASVCVSGASIIGIWKLAGTTEAQQHQQPHSSVPGASGEWVNWNEETFVGCCDATTTSTPSQLGTAIQSNATLRSVSARSRFQR